MTKEIKIVIERRGGLTIVQKKQAFAGHLSPKGIIERGRETDYLPRRLQNGIYLNFWDLGQFSDGAGGWVDIEFAVVKDLNVDSFDIYQSVQQPVLADYDSFKAGVFTVPMEDWKTSFRRLDFDKGERFGVDVYLGEWTNYNDSLDDTKYFAAAKKDSRPLVKGNRQNELVFNENWTEKGLKLSEKQTAQQFSLFTGGAFYNLIENGVEGRLYKVTSENNYSAPEVPFVIDASTDFFLFPALHVEQATDLSSNDPNEYGYLNLLYAPFPRAHFIDGAGWRGASGIDYDYSPLVINQINYSGGRTANTDAIIDLMKERADARFYVNQEGYGSVAAFPYSDVEIRYSRTNNAAGSSSLQTPEGTLLAVARKKGETFYFWLNYTGVHFNYLLGFAPGTTRFRMNLS